MIMGFQEDDPLIIQKNKYDAQKPKFGFHVHYFLNMPMFVDEI